VNGERIRALEFCLFEQRDRSVEGGRQCCDEASRRTEIGRDFESDRRKGRD
jgi:hypothetical protein